MRRITATALIASAAAIGCGSSDDATPAACLAGADAYVAALASAPQQARLDGSTPISTCLTTGQSAGDIATVGAAMIAATTELNRTGRTDPPGGAAGAGYMVGAVERGAAETSGIHTDLVLRIKAAARFDDGKPLPGAFRDAYAKGYAGGRDDG